MAKSAFAKFITEAVQDFDQSEEMNKLVSHNMGNLAAGLVNFEVLKESPLPVNSVL